MNAEVVVVDYDKEKKKFVVDYKQNGGLQR